MRDNGRINGRFTDPTPIDEEEFTQWLNRINAELKRVTKDQKAQPAWY